MCWSGIGEFFFQLSDPVRIYYLNYWTYVFTGFWTFESDTEWKTQLYKIYKFCIGFIYLFFVYSYFNEAVEVRYDLDKLSLNMSNNVLVSITVLKLGLLKMRATSVQKLLDNLTNNLNIKTIGHSPEDKEILEKRAKIILNLTRILYGLLVVSFCLKIMADTAFVTKSFLFPSPFKDYMKKHFAFFYVQQVILAFHFLMTVITHDLLIYGIINRLIAHFEILEKNFHKISRLYLIKRFEQTDAGNDLQLQKSSVTKVMECETMKYKYCYCEKNQKSTEEVAREMLKTNIYHHQTLLQEILNFSKIYSLPFIIQVIAAVFITGIVAIKILLLSSQITPLLMQQVLYVVINLFNNLCLCTLGSVLTSKSIAAANALYEIPWYEMGLENRRIVNFAIKKLLKGPKLKGGGLVVINNVTYLKVLQTSYNIVVLLRNLYKS